MAYFVIPENATFNVSKVQKVQPTDPVVDTHINGYFQTLLENDKALQNMDATNMAALRTELMREINKKLDGTGTVQTLAAILATAATGTVPDSMAIKEFYNLLKAAAFCGVKNEISSEEGYVADIRLVKAINDRLAEVEQSFLDGCRIIAQAITGGRDGEGTGGVPTAEDASKETMSSNITEMALLNYNQGLADGTQAGKTVARTGLVVCGEKDEFVSATAVLQPGTYRYSTVLKCHDNYPAFFRIRNNTKDIIKFEHSGDQNVRSHNGTFVVEYERQIWMNCGVGVPGNIGMTFAVGGCYKIS